MAGHQVGAGQGRQVPHLHAARRRGDDGQALTADDVVYAWSFQKKVLGGFDYLDKVTAVNARTVKFSFNKAFSTAFYEISGHYILQSTSGPR